MRLLVISTLLLGLLGLLAADGLPARRRPAAGDPCRAAHDYLDPTAPAMHAGLRFLGPRGLYQPAGPFATYTTLRDPARQQGQLVFEQEQLRFGTLYLVKGPHQEPIGQYSYLRSVTCVCGRDTMQVYVQPSISRTLRLHDTIPIRPGYWFYDSIPFRAGRYELVEPSRFYPGLPDGELERLAVAPCSFAAYYRQHQADLARDNPFAGCRFTGAPAGQYTPTPDGYVPRQPTEIFELLLAHTTYLKIRGWHLRSLRRHERVAPGK